MISYRVVLEILTCPNNLSDAEFVSFFSRLKVFFYFKHCFKDSLIQSSGEKGFIDEIDEIDGIDGIDGIDKEATVAGTSGMMLCHCGSCKVWRKNRENLSYSSQPYRIAGLGGEPL